VKRVVAFALVGALLIALAAVSVISLVTLINRTPSPSAQSAAGGILLVPLAAPEGLGEAPEDLLLAALATDLTQTFAAEVEQGAALPLSNLARAKGGEGIRADAALDELAHAYHRSGHLLLIGVTGAELSERGEDIFGYSQHGGNACIVSIAKLAAGASPEQVRTRLLKATLHQIGHVFGLMHSTDPQSVMYDAKDAAALDATRASYSEEELEALRRHPRLEGRLKQG
jgi:predicted Zn-dependent protease